MGTNRQVFASNPERDNFYRLSRQWGEKFRIYHNLPFLSVFNTKDLVNPEKMNLANILDPNVPSKLIVDDADFNRLKKTSIDYTLCDENEKPIICIEFDGLKDGFNVGTEYVFDGPPDPWREQITRLKLKVAHGSAFPFFVVGFREFKEIGDEVKLTMIDGIIGEVLSNQEIRRKINAGFVPESQEDFDQLGPGDQHEVVQDWVIGVEVEAEFTHNPVSVRVAELEREVGPVCSTTWLFSPDTGQSHKFRDLSAVVLFGCRCELHGGINTALKEMYLPLPDGPISATVWVPNFKSPDCGSMIGLAENLSQLVALEMAMKRRKAKPQ